MQALNASTELTPVNRRLNRQLATLATAARLLARHTGQRAVLLEILALLDQALAMVHGAIRLAPPGGDQISVEAVGGGRPEDHNAHRRRGSLAGCDETIADRVMATGRPLIVTQPVSPVNQGGEGSRPGDADDGRHGTICVPITLDKKTIGMIAVEVPCVDRARLADDERVLAIIASLIAQDVAQRCRENTLEIVTRTDDEADQPVVLATAAAPPAGATVQVGDAEPAADLKTKVKVLEREMIAEALRRNRGNAAAAARELGITPRIIRYKIRKLGLRGA